MRVCRGEVEDIRLLVEKLIPRARERRVEFPLVELTRRASVFREKAFMDSEGRGLRNPVRFSAHLPNSRSAFL